MPSCRKNIAFLFAAGLISLFVLTASTIVIKEFRAEIPDPVKNEIHVKWTVDEVPGVMHYVLKRKMVRDTDFLTIAEIQPQTGSLVNREYIYIDKNVFRTTSSEPVVYELYVKYTNGDSNYIGQAEVFYSSTAIRRTWGSIKAMFQ